MPPRSVLTIMIRFAPVSPALVIALSIPGFAAPPVLIAVVNRGENALSLIDPTGKLPAVKLPAGPAPHEAVACGNRILVSNYGAQSPGSTISVYDARARRQTATIDVAPLARPHGLVCAGEFAYFTAESNLSIGRIRLEDNHFDRIIGHGQKTGHMIARASASGVFTANISSGTISRIAPATGPGGYDVSSAKAGQSPEGIDVSPDGAQVWAANRGDSTISVIDTATMKSIDTLPTGKFVFRLRFTGDGKRVLATVPEAGEVLVFDAATRKVAARIAVEGTPVSVAISAGDRFAYVVAAAAAVVVEIDLETMTLTRTFPTGTGPDGVALVG
jgi:YVTN family beta-propeller protein